MNKWLPAIAFPVLLSFLAIAPIASTAVLGNTQNAYAGGMGSCGLDPSVVDVVLAPGASSQVILKKIDCNGAVVIVDIDATDCEASGIVISFDNTFVNVNGDWRGDETITNDVNAVPGDVPCFVGFEVQEQLGNVGLSQRITITTPDTAVGGSLVPIDTTSLLLAGTQMTASWMIPVIVSAIGIGIVIARKF